MSEANKQTVEVHWRCMKCRFVSRRRRVNCPDCPDRGCMVKQTTTWGWMTSTIGQAPP